MFAPIQLDLPEIICGTTYDPDAIVLLVDEELVDLTGCTAIIVIHNGESVIKTLTSTDGLTVSAGTIAIKIEPDDTKLLPGGDYSWYLNVTEASTDVYRYAEGSVSIRQEPEGPLVPEKAAVDVAYAIQNSFAKTALAADDELAIAESTGLRKTTFSALTTSLFPAMDERYSTSDGTQWFFGASEPSNDIGIDGDFYFRSNNYIYRKDAGVWGYVSTAKGETGEAGAAGATGAAGPQGEAGSCIIDSGTASATLNATYGSFGFYKTSEQYTAFNVDFATVPKVNTVPLANSDYAANPCLVVINSTTTEGFYWMGVGMNNGQTFYMSWTAAIPGGSSSATIGNSYACIDDYGDVDKTGGEDVTSVMQTAHNSGRTIFYPKGIYKFTTIDLPYGGGVIGEGKGLTRLYTTSTTGDVIGYTQSLSSDKHGGLTFKSFELTSNDRSSGGHIKIAPTGGYEIWDVDMFDVSLWHTYSGWVIDNAAHWKMTDCTVQNWWVSAVDIANAAWGDSGDSVIKGCTFGNGRTAGQGILQKSSGGLKVQANKFNGGHYGYVMDLTAGVSTSILLFNGNSIENQGTAAMAFNVGSGGYFCFATILGNEMALNPKGISVNAIGSRLQSAIIADNHISATNIAIEMAGGDKTLMHGNIISGAYAMSIGSGCTNGKAFGNIMSGSISNSSASFVIS